MSVESSGKPSAVHAWVSTTTGVLTILGAFGAVVVGGAVSLYRLDQQDRRNEQQEKRDREQDDRIKETTERVEKANNDLRNRFDTVVQAQAQQGAKMEMIYDTLKGRR